MKRTSAHGRTKRHSPAAAETREKFRRAQIATAAVIKDPLERLASLKAPTADIDQMIAETEAGRRCAIEKLGEP
jgi:hypothetical protein